MYESIIPKLYEMCLNNEFNGIQALQNDDLQIGYDKLDIFEKQNNISAEAHAKFEAYVLNEFTEVSEQIGFMCGFKVAVRLMSGIYGITK